MLSFTAEDDNEKKKVRSVGNAGTCILLSILVSHSVISTAMVPSALILSLIIRSLSLLLPQTFFQPDEFYQALEPAHRLVFGYGHLTWEWNDLPVTGGSGGWDHLVAGGRMRGWLWPSVFAGLYQILKSLKMDDTFLLVSCKTRDPKAVVPFQHEPRV